MSEDHFLNLQPGTIVNGRYEIVKCLGTGSMGMVYACRHRELSGHLVAMKVLFTEVARDNVAAARFRNEIVASYGVSHPNVVRAYEYFRDGDLVAFTMEYIGGGDLADRISIDQPMDIDEIVRMLIQMCSGVQAIHDAGIIHRDLKPENILVTAQNDIKITDFGIARTGAGPKLTEHGGVVGTIDYVSPEYLERGQVDRRSDIYALGVLAYEMITGESPFQGKSVIETMTMRLRTDPTAPHRIRQDCSTALSKIVLRAMARDPEHRYQQASEMQRDLQALGSMAMNQQQNEMPVSNTSPSMANQAAYDYNDVAEMKSPMANSREPTWTKTPASAMLAQTVNLDAKTVGRVKSSFREAARRIEEEYAPPRKLESVLSASQRFEVVEPDQETGSRVIPTVGISQSGLSPERIKHLSSAVYTEDESVFKRFVMYCIVVFVGFGAGVWLLSNFRFDRLFQRNEGTVSAPTLN